MTFGKRSAIFVMRSGDTELLEAALTAIAIIDKKRVDFRDILWTLGILWHVARKIGDPGDAFRRCAELAEPGTAQLIRDFTARDAASKDLQTSWGYAEIETEHGPGLIRWGSQRYNPITDLAHMALDVAAAIAQDHYFPSNIGIATMLPEVWLRGEDSQNLTEILDRSRGTASISTIARPGQIPDHESQQLTVFIVEAATATDAAELQQLSQFRSSNHCQLGAVAGNLFCLLVARSWFVGIPGHETTDSLKRFSEPILDVLKRFT